MNEELQERLMSYLETLEGAVSGTTDFVIDQAPIYVQELIRWQIAEGIIWCVFFLAVALGFFVINFTKLRSLRQKDDSAGWVFGFVAIVLMAFCIAIASKCGCQSLKAYLAPRVVIVEKLTGVVPASIIPLPAKK